MFWPQLKDEVSQWKFTPFTRGGKAVTAEVDESIELVPPERMPKAHVTAPPITKDSKVAIRLQRQWCDETCDFHTVAWQVPMELCFRALMESLMEYTETKSITARSFRWRRSLRRQTFTHGR